MDFTPKMHLAICYASRVSADRLRARHPPTHDHPARSSTQHFSTLFVQWTNSLCSQVQALLLSFFGAEDFKCWPDVLFFFSSSLHLCSVCSILKYRVSLSDALFNAVNGVIKLESHTCIISCFCIFLKSIVLYRY